MVHQYDNDLPMLTLNEWKFVMVFGTFSLNHVTVQKKNGKIRFVSPKINKSATHLK